MKTITFDLSDLHRHGSAFYDYLRLRKHFFVDTLGWDIPHNDAVEMDQYDNPLAHYSLVLRDGQLIGGARAMPTTSHWGEHTYMLRDAVAGRLPSIPRRVLGQEIDSPRIWECTRLVITEDLRTHVERARCLSLIVEGLADVAQRHGASELVSLTRLSLMRALRQLGWQCDRIGTPLCQPRGRPYLCGPVDAGGPLGPGRSGGRTCRTCQCGPGRDCRADARSASGTRSGGAGNGALRRPIRARGADTGPATAGSGIRPGDPPVGRSAPRSAGGAQAAILRPDQSTGRGRGDHALTMPG